MVQLQWPINFSSSPERYCIAKRCHLPGIFSILRNPERPPLADYRLSFKAWIYWWSSISSTSHFELAPISQTGDTNFQWKITGNIQLQVTGRNLAAQLLKRLQISLIANNNSSEVNLKRQKLSSSVVRAAAFLPGEPGSSPGDDWLLRGRGSYFADFQIKLEPGFWD